MVMRHLTNVHVILYSLWAMKRAINISEKEKQRMELTSQIVNINSSTHGKKEPFRRMQRLEFLLYFPYRFSIDFFSSFFWIFRKWLLIGKVKMRHFQSWLQIRPQTDIKYVYSNAPKGNDFLSAIPRKTITKLSFYSIWSARRHAATAYTYSPESKWFHCSVYKRYVHWINSINIHLFRMLFFGIGFSLFLHTLSLVNKPNTDPKQTTQVSAWY